MADMPQYTAKFYAAECVALMRMFALASQHPDYPEYLELAPLRGRLTNYMSKFLRYHGYDGPEALPIPAVQKKDGAQTRMLDRMTEEEQAAFITKQLMDQFPEATDEELRESGYDPEVIRGSK